jgi:type II secretory pathway component GspD/PulD (secretin)
MKRQGQQNSPSLRKPLVNMATGRRVAACFLASSILCLNMGSLSLAQVLDNTARPVRGQISISREVAIAPSKEKVSLSLRDASVQDVLQMLAKQGKFNLILDEGVSGSLTVDINNVSINKALEYIFTMMDLSYVKDANTVMVAKKSTVEGKNMAVRSLKTIPVQYKSAVNIANQLNNTIFKVPRSSGSGTALAAADPDSNSLLVMGTETDIKLVGDALRELDVPRNRKVYHIRHNMPTDVAQVLAANFFRNNASVSINTASGGTSGSSSSSSSTSGSSTGGSSTGGSSTGASGSTASGGAAGGAAGSSATGASGSTSTTGVSVTSFTADGVTFISEPVSATLTVLGTEEQISLIDSVIDQVDVQRAQVAIEVALVEIQNSDKKSFNPIWSSLSAGTGLIQLAPLSALAAGQNTFVIKNPFVGGNGVSLPTSVRTDGLAIQQSSRNVRSKVLANPTVVTIDGQAANINITDTVASITNSQTITSGIVTNTIIVTQQQAGVTVTLTPKVYNDGSV